MKKKSVLAATALAIAGVMGLAGCSAGASGGSGSMGDELVGFTGEIGAKNYAEQFILAHIATQALNAHGANLKANTKVAGSSNVYKAMVADQFVGYWEYTGTSWINTHGNTQPVKGAEAQFEATKAADAEDGIAWLNPTSLNNTYSLAIRSDKAKELGITKMSEIASIPASEQTFCMETEFSTRDDGWPGVKAAYGLDVPDSNIVTVDTGVLYTATADGKNCNFGEAFATDGRVPALDLLILEDDLEFFPIYQAGFVLKQTTLDKYPAIADILDKVSVLLDTTEMSRLNAMVDVDGEDPADVAEEWLTEKGLI